jgi:hypothetical protein
MAGYTRAARVAGALEELALRRPQGGIARNFGDDRPENRICTGCGERLDKILEPRELGFLIIVNKREKLRFG